MVQLSVRPLHRLAMDEDENISTLLAMGFPDIAEIKRALRLAKNDLNEAVAILTNEQPLSSYGTMTDLSLDVDMKYASNSGSGDTSSVAAAAEGSSDNNMEFPVTNLYELDTRVFQDNWSIPYKRDESLGKCLVAATKLAAVVWLTLSPCSMFCLKNDSSLSDWCSSMSASASIEPSSILSWYFTEKK